LEGQKSLNDTLFLDVNSESNCRREIITLELFLRIKLL